MRERITSDWIYAAFAAGDTARFAVVAVVAFLVHIAAIAIGYRAFRARVMP